MKYVEHAEFDENDNLTSYSVFPDVMATVNVSKDGTLFLDNINLVYGVMAGSYELNKKTIEAFESEPEPTIYTDAKSMLNDILGK